MSAFIPSALDNVPTRLPGGATVTPEAGTPASYGVTPGNISPTTDTQREFVVRLVNESETRTFRQRYLTNVYDLPPGAEMIVPWEVMVAFCGSPHVVNTARNPEREDVFRRLRVRYGVYDNIDDWHGVRPQIACYSVVTSERLNTVMEDPTGVGIHTSTRSIADEALMQNQIAALTMQLEALRSQVMDQSAAQVIPTPIAPPEARDDEQLPLVPVTASGATQTSFPLTNPNAPDAAPVQIPITPGRQIFAAPPASAIPVPTSDAATEDVPQRPKVG